MSGVQIIKQRLRLLQVERVEAFGKPAVHRSEQFACLIPLALIAPEPRHAHRRAKFKGIIGRAQQLLRHTFDGERSVSGKLFANRPSLHIFGRISPLL
jgi:hypothetical protein